MSLVAKFSVIRVLGLYSERDLLTHLPKNVNRKISGLLTVVSVYKHVLYVRQFETLMSARLKVRLFPSVLNFR